MKLPTGHCIRVVRTGTHAKHGCVLMLIDFWQSAADFEAGKPGIRHDCTFGLSRPGNAVDNKALRFTGPALRFFETSRSLPRAGK
jgi:hypothetical protein